MGWDRTATQAPAFSNRLAVAPHDRKGVSYDTTARCPGSARRAHPLLMGRDILQATLLQCTSKRTTRTTNTHLAHRVRKETTMKRVGLWALGLGLFITVGLLTVEQGY